MQAVALLASALLALALQQQQQPPAQQQPPTFRTSAELVRVYVTVLDRNGKPVTTLKQDDFVVFEDDVPQRIQAFQFVAFNGQHGPEEDLDGGFRHGALDSAAARAQGISGRTDQIVYLGAGRG